MPLYPGSVTLLRISTALLLTFIASIAPAADSIKPFSERQKTEGRQICDGAMSPDFEVAHFKHSDRWFAARTVRHASHKRDLPKTEGLLPANIRFEVSGKRYDLFDYLSLNRVAGLLVLKNGCVALEEYDLGINPGTHWPSFSMAKSVSSTLVAAAIKDGLIHGLDDPLTEYVPTLKGGAYDGVSVRNVLQMASGVKWDETYTDPHSDSRALFEEQFLQRPGTIIRYMSARGRTSAPGSVWNYNTGETYIVGALLEGATHRPLANYLREKIWEPAGMESDATWSLETPDGMGLAGTGLAATLRDYGRLGLLIQQGGIVNGNRIVPEGWFEQAGRAKVIGGKPVNYGYLWWPLPAGDPIQRSAFQAIGIFGQHLYINPQQLVIVVLSARPKPTGSTVIDDNAFFAAVAKALA